MGSAYSIPIKALKQHHETMRPEAGFACQDAPGLLELKVLDPTRPDAMECSGFRVQGLGARFGFSGRATVVKGLAK